MSGLVELRVRDLGVIADLTLLLGRGMTALTGETGAGKTLVVEAIELLVGGRADSVLVRPGATEALVEGRFDTGDDAEDATILSRAVPASGRSRAYVDGRMAPIGALAERGAGLVDLHGQHAHQSLLSAGTQRASLDAFGSIDLGPLQAAKAERAAIDSSLSELGGDEQARAREIDLLGYQVEELDRAGVHDADEDAALSAEEDALSDATAHREAASGAVEAMAGEGAAVDALGSALALVQHRAPLAELEGRLRTLVAEAQEAAADLRAAAEALEDDPARLAEVRERRQLLRDLERKYGPTLADVMTYHAAAEDRLRELQSYEERATALQRRRDVVDKTVASAAAVVGAARRVAAPSLAAAVQAGLADLAMPRARLEVVVGEADPGDDVTFLLGANPGEPALPMGKVASGGELARSMLATRLALGQAGDAPSVPTLVFDEVDAGIGGEAALAVGRALAALAKDHQVLVVTHLPQVAAFADHQIVVRKAEVGGRTVATAIAVEGEDRLVELSRMLSGQPESAAARTHAEELLALARTPPPPAPGRTRRRRGAAVSGA